MKWGALGLVSLVLVVAATVVWIVRHDSAKVQESSMRAWSQIYAKDVARFFKDNNRFPNSTLEVKEDIFGDRDSNYSLVVLDEKQRVFAIRAAVRPDRTIETRFQLSSTGLVERLPSLEASGN